MASPDEGAQRVRSIKSLRAVFEQRADLDAFWVASVDFSKDKVGLSTRLFGRVDSEIQDTLSATESLTDEGPGPSAAACAHIAKTESDVHRVHESWRELHHAASPEVSMLPMGTWAPY